MSSARIGVGLATAAFTGGIAAYRYFRKRKIAAVEKIPIPPQLEEAAPEVIYQEEKPKPAPQRPKPFVIDLKTATENIRSALNLVVLLQKTMALGGILLLAGESLATTGTRRSRSVKYARALEVFFWALPLHTISRTAKSGRLAAITN